MSNGLDVQPIITMNRASDFTFHVFGFTKYSGSTSSLSLFSNVSFTTMKKSAFRTKESKLERTRKASSGRVLEVVGAAGKATKQTRLHIS
jgi:hypothetical protein